VTDGLAEALSWLGRRAVAAGLVAGSGGNLSAREGGAGTCLVTAAGSWLDELTAGHFSLVRIDDGVVVGGHATPSTELGLHLAAYRARPDIAAVVHLHPQTALVLDRLEQPIELLTADHQHYVGAVRTVPALPSGTTQLADAVAAELGSGCNCVILAGHGCAVVADSVELAAKRALNLEEAARTTYRWRVLQAALTRGGQGTGELGR
jgi:L-fuculose-phosphate aldolase